MMSYSLLNININKIDLCAIQLKIHFYCLIHHINLKYFNIYKNILYIKKSVVGQDIIFNKNKITEKKSLITTTLKRSYDEVMSKNSNVKLRCIKVLTIIQI